MNILRIPCGPLATNTYILYNDGSTDAVVIDPALSRKAISALRENNLHCSHILITHGHFDHIMGAAALKAEENAQIYIHRLDAPCLNGSDDTLAYMGGAMVTRCDVDMQLEDEQRFSAAGFDFLVLHTPGHSAGSCCFVLEKERVIFSGDTLFRLSVGRTDLPGGNTDTLYSSLVHKLMRLKGDYRVLPGHDRETTLDFEREHNPFIRRGGMAY